MKDFFDNIIASIGINDVLDILIVSFIVYKILGFIRETRAQQLVKGLLVLVVAFFLSDIYYKTLAFFMQSIFIIVRSD